MAYNTDELLQLSLSAIEKHNLIFIEDVIAYLPCSKTTFYEHKLNESDTLKERLFNNRTIQKIELRNKWFESDNPTLQIALYKQLATNEERKRLSQSFIEIEETSSIQENEIDYSKLKLEELSEDLLANTKTKNNYTQQLD